MECIVNGNTIAGKLCAQAEANECVLRQKHFSFILFPVLANERDERTQSSWSHFHQ